MSTYCRCHAGVYPCPRLAGRTYRSSPLTVLDRAQDLVSTDTLWLASCRLSIGWQIIEIPLRVARSRRAWQAWGPALQIAPYWRANSLTSAAVACRERLDRDYGRGVQPLRGTRR